MAWMKDAIARPIQENYTHRITAKDCIILHVTAAPNATSQYGWFNNPNAQASSHFHVAYDGTKEQYIDTDHMSWANADGNPRSITIETQGGGTGAWTAAQITAIIEIIQWICSVHTGIPLRQMASSKTSEKGIGWHRLGVNGNFPTTGILRGRTQRGGGETWSNAYGKVCPGNDRIKQIPSIIKQASDSITESTPEGLSMSDVNKIMTELNKKASAAQVNSVYVRQRENHAELQEMIGQIAQGAGVSIDYTKVEQAAKAGAKAALAEGIDIDAQAEVTFHETSQDEVTD